MRREVIQTFISCQGLSFLVCVLMDGIHRLKISALKKKGLEMIQVFSISINLA